MSEILVESGATYPASVTVPEDGDARNAASVVVGFQALANRCAYFLAKVVSPLLAGGNWLVGGAASGLQIDLSGGRVLFKGNNDYSVEIASSTQLRTNQRIIDHLFVAGGTGMANRKTLNLVPASGSTTLIDPIGYNEIAIDSAAGVCTAQINPAAVPLPGTELAFHVDSANAVVIKNQAGGTILSLANSVGNMRSMTVYWDGSIWRRGHTSPASP